MMASTYDQKFTEAVRPKDILDKKVKRMTIEVPKDLHTALRQASIDQGGYIRDIVVDACKEHLRKEGYDI